MWMGNVEKMMELNKHEVEKRANQAWMWMDESPKKTFLQKLLSLRTGNKNVKTPPRHH